MECVLRELAQSIARIDKEFDEKYNICGYEFIQTKKVEYNEINEYLDILHSMAKYDGKIRLFIQLDFIQVACMDSTIDCKHRKEVIKDMKLLGIETCILEKGNLMYYITINTLKLLHYFNYKEIRVFSRNAKEYENIKK
jgi:hypothetical protein